MNKWLMSRSRRERFYLLSGGAILLFGLVVYPLIKWSAAHRAEQAESLGQTRELLVDYQSVIDSKDSIESANRQLAELMRSTDGLLFERIGNNVMMEAMMTKLLNQFGSELKLDISETRAALRDESSLIRYQVKGTGRYPAILSFIYKIEDYRPFIVIDSVSVSAAPSRPTRQTRGGRPSHSSAQSSEETTEPEIKLQLNIHINCTSAEDKS